MQAIIQATNVSHHYGKQSSVKALSLTLGHGEVMALLGTNGAGKTTTLRLLSGELAPDSGQITINNIDLNLHPLKAKKCLGYLPDTAPLYDDLSVNEYLSYCASIRSMNREQIRQRVQAVKTFCELESVGNRLIKKLSKGYQQRIGIAQAIIHEPKAIILDEPTNGLDPTQIHEMRDLILHLRNDAAVLLSTHHLNDVEQICDRVHMLKQGSTVFCKKIDDLQQATRVRARFNITPPIGALNNIHAIEKVHTINDNTIELVISEDLDKVKIDLLAMSQSNHWGLVEIYDIRETLENVFVSEVLRGIH
ncbi:MAG: ABC transporter ATP-binding protein [Gammaproteobacteria bacterium]|nr:ABC transporter ATP-binding protein [Gammaproteobacteria bacterium]